MKLRDAVEKYLAATGEFERPLPLAQLAAALALSREDFVRLVSEWDEDYHLHRHFELIPASWMTQGEPAYAINGAEYTAILFRASIRDILD